MSTTLLKEMRKAKLSDGLATVLAVGTANPPNEVDQSTYPDYYFRVTNSDHHVDLKSKFKRICDGTTIRRRHLHLTEEMLEENPNLCSWMDATHNLRREMVMEVVPRIGKESAEKALEEWGRPRSEITHLVFCTTCAYELPGADLRLMKLLGLSPTVQRMMMYFQGCFAGAMALRFAKDIVENNRHARVLAVCSETTTNWFRGPNPAHVDNLVGQAVLGDGAAALVVGADPVPDVEKPLFEIVSASQRLIPDSEHGVAGNVTEGGLTFHLSKEVPSIFSSHIESVMSEAFAPLGVSDWNSIFWMAHPGGPAFFDKFEVKLGLRADKLWASRHVLREYGNMSSASVLFIMDEMRKRAAAEGLPTTGDGLEYGVLLGMGPGLTAETVVLRSCRRLKD